MSYKNGNTFVRFGGWKYIKDHLIDFKGQYLSVLGLFSTCQCLVSYDSSMPASVGTFSSDTPLDRVSGLTSVQLESTAHGNLAESLFCLMWACCQNNTRMEAMQLWENVRRNRLGISHTFSSPDGSGKAWARRRMADDIISCEDFWASSCYWISNF